MNSSLGDSWGWWCKFEKDQFSFFPLDNGM
jgi:hypothetical protein